MFKQEIDEFANSYLNDRDRTAIRRVWPPEAHRVSPLQGAVCAGLPQTERGAEDGVLLGDSAAEDAHQDAPHDQHQGDSGRLQLALPQVGVLRTLFNVIRSLHITIGLFSDRCT